MKFIRYAVGKTEYRGVTDGEIIKRINGTIFHDYSVSSDVVKYDDVRLLTPISPSKIICTKVDNDELSFYLKPASSLIAHGESIIKPANVHSLHSSAELAVVIGKKCRNISASYASNFIFGYSVANNISADDELGTLYDTFTPIAPIINSSFDCNDYDISLIHNGNAVESNKSFDILTVNHVVAFLSNIMTLMVGDVILIGASNCSTKISVGDTVTCEISNIGKVTNMVIDSE